MSSHNFKNREGIHSDRKWLEETSKDNEIYYRLLAENVTDVILIMDMDLRFTNISPSVERMRGYSVEESLVL